MKNRLILTALLAFSALKPVSASDHWEALVLPGDVWRYLVPTSEPQANWISNDFSETGWGSGRGGFGYGDNDDVTQIVQTLSVYLRRTFEVKDITKIEALIFAIDYDDAFVAYLNGVEIARSPGLTGERPAFNQRSSISHEAVLYQGGVPDTYRLDAGLLRQGMNVLAVQVHNENINSSDLSAIPFLFAGISERIRRYQPTPSWFIPPFDFTSSNLPIVIIDTQGQTIADEPKITAKMQIIDNGPGARNYLNDPPSGYDGWIGIEKRGNATQSYEVVQGKWSYTIETRNEDGSDNDVKLLGMPKDKDWILLAAFIDKTLMRDAIAYHMSRSIGRWAPRTRHVELVLNGRYEGVYVLVEKIKWGKNRLNITKIKPTDVSGDALTGGYIWAVQQADGTDVVFGSNGNMRVLKYPKAKDVQPEQLEYIRKADDEVKALVDRSYFRDPERGYHKYIDVSSFIDELIVQEATKNSDAYGWSGFFHKDRLGKICAGPVWDFDQAIANSTHQNGDVVEYWMIEHTDGMFPKIWLGLWKDPAFKEDVANRWFQYRSGPLRTERLFAFIDSLAVYLDEAQQRNFQRWPILGVEIWRSLPGARQRNTYQKEVDYMKAYLQAHMEWMDRELRPHATVNKRQEAEAVALPVRLTPNPFRDRTALGVTLPEDGYVEIKVYNTLGQLVRTIHQGFEQRGEHLFHWDGRDNAGLPAANGLYFYLIDQNGFRFKTKVIKF